MKESRLVEVFSSQTVPEAQFAKSVLDGAGISAYIFGDNLVGSAPYFGMLDRVKVMVSEEQLATAREILQSQKLE